MAGTQAAEKWRKRLSVPNYKIGEAARYVHISPSTVASWHSGRGREKQTLAHREARSKLSYLQLIEVAFVASCRKAGMKLKDIALARDYLSEKMGIEHPFASQRLKTDGVDIALDYDKWVGRGHSGTLLIANKSGQLAWNQFIGERLKEFEYEDDLALRWHVGGVGSSVIIDPRIRFGAPIVRGVPTWLLKERWEAGEPIQDTAEDLNVTVPHIEEALRFEGILDLNAQPSTCRN